MRRWPFGLLRSAQSRAYGLVASRCQVSSAISQLSCSLSHSGMLQQSERLSLSAASASVSSRDLVHSSCSVLQLSATAARTFMHMPRAMQQPSNCRMRVRRRRPCPESPTTTFCLCMSQEPSCILLRRRGSRGSHRPRRFQLHRQRESSHRPWRHGAQARAACQQLDVVYQAVTVAAGMLYSVSCCMLCLLRICFSCQHSCKQLGSRLHPTSSNSNRLFLLVRMSLCRRCRRPPQGGGLAAPGIWWYARRDPGD
jgi:hypothetical protein